MELELEKCGGAECLDCGFCWYAEEPNYCADDQMIQDWQAAQYMIEPN